MTEEQKARRREYHRKWRAANREHVREQSRAAHRRYREADPARSTDRTLRWREKHPEAYLLTVCKKSARERGHKCELTLEQVKQLVAPMRCSVTGLELSWGDVTHPWKPSIDRLDNARGYHLDNVRLVCWAYNNMRSLWSDEVFLQVAQALIDRK